MASCDIRGVIARKNLVYGGLRVNFDNPCEENFSISTETRDPTGTRSEIVGRPRPVIATMLESRRWCWTVGQPGESHERHAARS